MHPAACTRPLPKMMCGMRAGTADPALGDELAKWHMQGHYLRIKAAAYLSRRRSPRKRSCTHGPAPAVACTAPPMASSKELQTGLRGDLRLTTIHESAGIATKSCSGRCAPTGQTARHRVIHAVLPAADECSSDQVARHHPACRKPEVRQSELRGDAHSRTALRL